MSLPAGTPDRPRRFGMLWYWLTLLLIGLFSISPMFLFIAGAVIAGDHGCAINEGNTSPCMIDGQDWAQTLQFFGLSPLYLIATFPLAIVFFVVWLVVLLIHRGAFKRRERVA